jgi:hypothetical protein
VAVVAVVVVVVVVVAGGSGELLLLADMGDNSSAAAASNKAGDEAEAKVEAETEAGAEAETEAEVNAVKAGFAINSEGGPALLLLLVVAVLPLKALPEGVAPACKCGNPPKELLGDMPNGKLPVLAI